MKTIFTLIVAFSFAFTLQAQQYTLLSKQTADWCPRCGGWGWDFVKQAQEEMKDENLIYWGLHFDGGLATPTSQAIVSNFETGYQPVFFLNQDNLNVSSTNISEKVQEAKQTVQLLNSFPSSIEVDVEASIIGTTVTANAEVSFSEGTETDYNMGVYLVRDNVVAFQSGQGPSAVHPNLLDAAFHADPWGDIVNDGNTINAGDKFETSYTLLDVVNHSGDLNDLKVVAVVWYNVNGEYTFINGEIKSIVNGTSATNDIQELEFTHSYNPGMITIELKEDLDKDTQVFLFGMDGGSIPVNMGQLNKNSLTAEINAVPSGTYILNVRSGGVQGSRKIFIIE